MMCISSDMLNDHSVESKQIVSFDNFCFQAGVDKCVCVCCAA